MTEPSSTPEENEAEVPVGLRVSKELLAALKKAAKDNSRSVAGEIRHLLKRTYGGEGK